MSSVTTQDMLRAMAGIHPGLNDVARKLLNDAADELDRAEHLIAVQYVPVSSEVQSVQDEIDRIADLVKRSSA